MYRTIQVSSCLSIQGECVEVLANGDVLIRDGRNVYSGRPIIRRPPSALRVAATERIRDPARRAAGDDA